jgi:uncharacterized damage-inducible protein DinB
MNPVGGSPHRGAALVERYAAGGPILVQALTDLTPEQQRAHPGPGEWSLAQVAAHLVDTDLVFAERMKRVLAEDNPALISFDENAWISRLDGHSMPVDDAASLFAANRRWIARLLRRASESDFSRVGIHSQKGPMTLAELLSYVTNHLDHHLRFVYAKRANLGTAVEPRYTAN